MRLKPGLRGFMTGGHTFTLDFGVFILEIGRLPSLRSLIAFQTVARYGSFSRAAGILGLTQSGVSRQIAQLEDHVGAALFERLASGVHLSLVGEDYAKDVGRALEALARLDAGPQSQQAHDRVTLACSRGVADLWVLPRLLDLRAAFPGLELKLIVNDFFAQLRADEYDLAIYYRANRPADTISEVLGPEEMFPVMASGQSSMLDQATPVILTVEESLKEWTDWGNWLSASGVALSKNTTRWRLGDYHLSVEGARRGLGIAMGWTWVLGDQLAKGVLVPAHDFVLKGPGHYYLMRPAARHQRQITRHVADWFLQSNPPAFLF